MPTYSYHCPENGVEADVFHSMNSRVQTWGELRELTGADDDGTPTTAPVERRVTAGQVTTRGRGGPAASSGGCGTRCGCH